MDQRDPVHALHCRALVYCGRTPHAWIFRLLYYRRTLGSFFRNRLGWRQIWARTPSSDRHDMGLLDYRCLAMVTDRCHMGDSTVEIFENFVSGSRWMDPLSPVVGHLADVVFQLGPQYPLDLYPHRPSRFCSTLGRNVAPQSAKESLRCGPALSAQVLAAFHRTGLGGLGSIPAPGFSALDSPGDNPEVSGTKIFGTAAVCRQSALLPC